MIRFENVGLRYGMGPEILRDISFHIPERSFQFLSGPSGAGKTTLLRLLFLSLKPTRGLITIFGKDRSRISRSELPAMRRRIGSASKRRVQRRAGTAVSPLATAARTGRGSRAAFRQSCSPMK